MWSPWISLGLLFFALPIKLWPGLALGAGLFVLLRRSHYRSGLLWFAALPGLYLLMGGGGWQEQLERLTQWGLLSGALALWGHAWGRMLEGERLAALWLLPVLLVKAAGPVLAGVVLAHGLYTLERERRMSQEVGRGFGTGRHAGLGLAVGLAIMALAASFLPLPRITLSTQPATPPPALTQPAEEASPPPVQPVAPRTITVRVAAETPFARFASNVTEALLTGILLLSTVLMAVLLWMALRERSSWKLGPSRGSLVLLAAALTWGLLVYWFALSRAGNGDGNAVGNIPSGPRPRLSPGGAATEVEVVNQDWSYALVMLGALLVFLALLLALVLLLRWRSGREAEARLEPKPAYSIGGWRAGPPANRIRRAYYEFLHEMERRGQARHFFESPREYARRMAKVAPSIRGSLEELTALYEPVRYGDPSDERRAERAEFLAGEIPRHFQEEKGS